MKMISLLESWSRSSKPIAAAHSEDISPCWRSRKNIGVMVSVGRLSFMFLGETDLSESQISDQAGLHGH